MRKKLGISIISLGVLSGLMFFYAGFNLNAEGQELQELRSVGGSSVAENYYQSMGKYGVAYSTICYALGFGIVAISLGFGGNLLTIKNEFINEHHLDKVKALSEERLPDIEKPVSTSEIVSIEMIDCPICDNKCSSQAVTCPKCNSKLEDAKS